MASDTLVRQIVEERLEDNWTATPIAWDNGEYIPQRGVAYISPKLSGTGSTINGPGCRRKTYLLLVEVRVPKLTGSALATDLAEQLVDLFEAFSEGNFHCKKGWVERVTIGQAWHQRNAMLEIQYNEYK